MVDTQRARKLALALAGAVEKDHHGFPSFRVAQGIFATLPDDEHMNVMLAADGVQRAIDADPDACSEKWWGKQLAGVSVFLPAVGAEHLARLLAEAHQHVGARRR